MNLRRRTRNGYLLGELPVHAVALGQSLGTGMLCQIADIVPHDTETYHTAWGGNRIPLPARKQRNLCTVRATDMLNTVYRHERYRGNDGPYRSLIFEIPLQRKTPDFFGYFKWFATQVRALTKTESVKVFAAHDPSLFTFLRSMG